MLNEALPFSPSTGEPGALSRARRGLSRARSIDELRGPLAALLASLYRPGSRFELFFRRDGHLVPMFHRDGPEARESRALLASIRTRLLASGRSMTEPQAVSPHESSGHRPLISAPIHSLSDDLVGLLVVEGAPLHPPFDRMELVALEGVAALVAAAPLEEARDHSPSALRLDLDRQAARRIQRGFMSARLPDGVGITAHAEYLPAFDVGGDFYGVTYAGDHTVCATIGDVSGNGVSAALLMSRVTADFEHLMTTGASPSSVLASVNARLGGGTGDMFVTAAYASIDTARRRLTIANAGHLPLVVRRANGEVFTFGGASGTPLGMMPCDYAEDELALEPADILLFVTDGLLEALDHPTGHRGLELLVDEVHASRHDVDAISARLRETVAEARSEHGLDDVTWVGLQVTG